MCFSSSPPPPPKPPLPPPPPEPTTEVMRNPRAAGQREGSTGRAFRRRKGKRGLTIPLANVNY